MYDSCEFPTHHNILSFFSHFAISPTTPNTMIYRLLPAFALASVIAASPDTKIAYDYVIIGAGTSGLVIANRLSELNVTVAVIEAGDYAYNNTDVTNPSGYGLAFGSAIDWAYQTTSQAYAGDKVQTLRAGKAIGGTSTINGMLSYHQLYL